MAIINKATMQRGFEIDLTGPDGNAFALLGQVKNLARATGADPEAICKEMTSGNYENLVAVFDREFGSFVTLIR